MDWEKKCVRRFRNRFHECHGDFHPRLSTYWKKNLNVSSTKLKEDLTSEFYLPAAIDAELSRVKSRVRFSSCAWMGVTYKEDKLNVVKK